MVRGTFSCWRLKDASKKEFGTIYRVIKAILK
jgi:hypothetical protein